MPNSLSAELEKRLPPEKLLGYIEELLNAQRPIYATVDGNQKVVGHEPDYVAMNNGLKWALNYKEGLPLKRVVEIKRHEANDAEVIDRLSRKPAMRRAYREFLDSCDKAQSIRISDLAKQTRGEAVENDD